MPEQLPREFCLIEMSPARTIISTPFAASRWICAAPLLLGVRRTVDQLTGSPTGGRAGCVLIASVWKQGRMFSGSVFRVCDDVHAARASPLAWGGR